ncbi:hypothetical protein N752_13685 [Desulforamulus aquiferis]|nr:cyclodeaminase/cyclohydrolase family protein [Desulforamulus aquiferis]RYD04421.1 hypothetical protein N752_13685 [Desulforamulus aquiferis]
MHKYLKWSVDELFDRACSTSPEPGGGGVSAMTGCLGSGMLMMVAKITAGNNKYQDVRQEIEILIASIESNIEALKSLAQKDMDAFNGFMDALSLPRETPEQVDLREEKKQQAALLSAGIPLEMARISLANLQSAAELAVIGSKLAISDVGVGANLLEASLKGALIMVDANLLYKG